MLLISDRVSPCRARLSRSSLGRFTSRVPSPFSTVMGDATLWDRVPLGPLTVTMFAWTCTSTPDGTGTGSLPMRDIASTSASSSCSGSPDVGEDFPTYTLAVGLTVGEQALAGRDDRDAEAAEHLRQGGVLGVHAQAGLADPAYAGNGALTAAAVLELDLQRLADHALEVLDLEGGDVPLLLEDLGDALLELAVGHRHRVVVRLVGVAQTRQHVCDRVSHRHGLLGPFSTPVSHPRLGATCSDRWWWWVTRSSWSRPAARRRGPSPGGRCGTGRTCGRRPWAGRSAGSACSR